MAIQSVPSAADCSRQNSRKALDEMVQQEEDI
jgi:hypothetical protein